jgi:hypothetical protein
MVLFLCHLPSKRCWLGSRSQEPETTGNLSTLVNSSYIYTHTKSGSQFFVLFSLEPQNSKVSFAKIMSYKLVEDRHPGGG